MSAPFLTFDGTPVAAEATASDGHQTLTIILFGVIVAGTLGITIWASRQNRSAADFYAGGRSFTGMQNGLAIGGDYMSAASFLGITGIIALYGYDGFLYSIGFLVAWLVALLLVAELMRNTGKFTMADVLSFRMRQRPVRTAASISTVVVSIFYLLAQMVGAGELVSLLLGISSAAAKNGIIALVGVLMIVYVVFGGMKGTTWVQIIKAVLLLVGTGVLTVWVLAKYGFNISGLMDAAANASGKGDAFIQPGQRYGVESADATKTLISKLDFISLGLALVLGTAGLPHILIRFYTVPDSKAARKSVNWAIGIIGLFYLMVLVLGLGAAALVGGAAITAQSKGGNTAAPQLAEALGGQGTTLGAAMLALIAAVAFATILAVVAGLALASSASVAHDLYANVIRRGRATDAQEVRVGRIAAVVIGAVAIALAIPAQSLNVAFLVALAFAIAASANLPAILLSLFWKKFNTRGATWGIYGGLGSALVLLVFSPNVSGTATSLIPSADFDWFPLANPGLVSIPLGFIFAIVGALTSSEHDKAKWAELEVRSLTGLGAEKAVGH
ncbi:sodium/solute symporter [Nakamurella sp. YIM 132087]|uniref:Sodium/solute symporter n=1 Tax=Nakamurella alba TaxID=2665158 RepID=A0A7K1FIH7_9ACTN|nr:cation acetate symporter [Nakamurella alba]MTD12694.1 sodium/solute symporter [Nakamurella alba]